MALRYIGFKTPVTLHASGTVTAWERKKMGDVKPQLYKNERLVHFEFTNGEVATVPFENVSYWLVDAAEAKPKEQPKGKP